MTTTTVPVLITTLKGRVGDDLVVETEVGNIVVPYTVIFNDQTIVYGRTDRRETIRALQLGSYRLTWSFSHTEKGWSHKLSAGVGSGGLHVLEEKAEAKKDSPYSIGWAVVVIS